MPESRKRLKILRCPYCLSKEIDVLLHQDGDTYYCIKCSFTGSYEEIMQLYIQQKKKFLNRTKRITLQDIEKL